MTLLELAERCEKATGPDRELDRAIQLAIRKSVPSDKWTGRDTIPPQKPRHFTDSLDAAMTLVPKGWRYAGSETSQGDWYAHLITRDYSSDHCTRLHSEATAATGPLSICAAALRARATKGADK